jgi:hypothetical protein
MEQQIGGKERPADIALEQFDPKGPLAVDLCIHHPLQPSAQRDPDKVRSSLASKEQGKVRKYAALCESAGWQFCPLGFHPWGGLGPMGSALLNRIVKQAVGDAQGWVRMQRVMGFWQTISFSLMRFVAQQLMPVLSTVPGDPLPRLELAPARHMQEQAARQVQEQAALLAGPSQEGMDLASLPVSHLDTSEWAVEPSPDGLFRVGCLLVHFAPRNN